MIKALREELRKLPLSADLSDLGNVLGQVVGSNTSDELGYDLDDFESGFRHGVSVAMGEHP